MPMKNSFLAIRRRRPGVSLPEYALILALVTVFCLAALSFFGQSFSNFFTAGANVVTTNVNQAVGFGMGGG